MNEIPGESVRVTLVDCETPFEALSGTFVNHRFAPHTHESYAIGTIERGATLTRYRGETVRHCVGDVVVIEPGEAHTGEAATAEGWTYRMVYVPREMMAMGGERRAAGFARSAYRDPMLAERFVEMHRLLESAAVVAEKLAALDGFLRALISRHGCTDGGERGVLRTAALERVRLHLEAHYGQRVAISELAVLAGMSTFHLIRQFRRAYGLPPYMYLEQVRITRAREMLKRGERISDAAYNTGFSDQSHFTRRFKRVVGVPPGQYASTYAKSDVRWAMGNGMVISEKHAVVGRWAALQRAQASPQLRAVGA